MAAKSCKTFEKIIHRLSKMGHNFLDYRNRRTVTRPHKTILCFFFPQCLLSTLFVDFGQRKTIFRRCGTFARVEILMNQTKKHSITFSETFIGDSIAQTNEYI